MLLESKTISKINQTQYIKYYMVSLIRETQNNVRNQIKERWIGNKELDFVEMGRGTENGGK